VPTRTSGRCVDMRPRVINVLLVVVPPVYLGASVTIGIVFSMPILIVAAVIAVTVTLVANAVAVVRRRGEVLARRSSGTKGGPGPAGLVPGGDITLGRLILIALVSVCVLLVGLGATAGPPYMLISAGVPVAALAVTLVNLARASQRHQQGMPPVRPLYFALSGIGRLYEPEAAPTTSRGGSVGHTQLHDHRRPPPRRCRA
jgi:hypothetical protein